MVLINCKECNKKVSNKANKCPDCGFPFNEEIQTNPEIGKEIENFGKKMMKIGLGLISLVFLIFILLFIFVIIYLIIF